MVMNLFTITGKFNADTIAIESEKNNVLLDYHPSHADKIFSIKNGSTITAKGRIVSCDLSEITGDSQSSISLSPVDYIFFVEQIETFSAQENENLKGTLTVKVKRWESVNGQDDGPMDRFVVGETYEGEEVRFYVPKVYERIYKRNNDILAGSTIKCFFKTDDNYYWCLWAKRIEVIDDPVKIIHKIQPNKAAQKWDDFIKNGEKKERVKRNVSKSLRREILMRDGFRCRECGVSPEHKNIYLEVDHIIPVSKGGTNDKNNLQTLCSDCNGGKLDKMPKDFDNHLCSI